MRKNFYSHVHRYMRQFLSAFEITVAKTDFSDSEQTAHLKKEFDALVKLLDMHAGHEDRIYHPLIQEKEPRIFQQMVDEHKDLDERLKSLSELLGAALRIEIDEMEQHTRGEKFYLSYTTYLIEYFKHLLHEELVVMPAMQKHYSDDELRKVTFITYDKMSAEDMIGMLQTLFPHINRYQKQVFLDDIAAGYPEKFVKVFAEISKQIVNLKERALLSKRYTKDITHGDYDETN